MAFVIVVSPNPKRSDAEIETLTEQPGERWERQFYLMEAPIGGFYVTESVGNFEPIAAFSTEDQARVFIAGIQLGQRSGHRSAWGEETKSEMPPYDHSVPQAHFDRLIEGRDERRRVNREKRAARARRKAAMADDTVPAEIV